MNQDWPLRHRSHDVVRLLRRWRAVARAARLKVNIIHETGGFPVYFLTTQRVTARPLYLSAGVHGDEAASVLGLLEWAEHSIRYLRTADVILLPLFNPVGLSLNTRLDGLGNDLNRSFDHPIYPHIVGWRGAMVGFTPRLAVCLHEDYDAQGLYAYELNRQSAKGPAEFGLTAAQDILPRDRRRVIEGRPARAALIRLRRLPMVENLPEAVALFSTSTPCAVTFESPSEFSIAQRAGAQVRFIESMVRWDAAVASPNQK